MRCTETQDKNKMKPFF